MPSPPPAFTSKRPDFLHVFCKRRASAALPCRQCRGTGKRLRMLFCSTLVCSVLCQRCVDVLLERGKIFFFIDAPQQRLSHHLAAAVKDIGSGERHDAQRKTVCLTAGIKADVSVVCPRCRKELLCGLDALRVAVQRLGIDTDDLAPLFLYLLVQGIQVVQLLHTGLAAVEPEIHHRKGVLRKQADGNWSAAWRMPVSIPGTGPAVFCYPMPTHSIHSRIAFENTVSASPRHIPKRIISTAAASNSSCACFL